MAIQKNSYDGLSAGADPAGDAPVITRITGFIIIDTVVGGISGDNGDNLSLDLTDLLASLTATKPVVHFNPEEQAGLTALTDSVLILEIAPGRNVRFINDLPDGVTLQAEFDLWSDTQIGLLNDEVYHILYDGPKIKNNKIFPYPGFQMRDAADRVYVEINNTADSVKYYW